MGSSLREEAEELAMALEHGFANVDEVIDWADANICAMDTPPFELIEVSTAGRKPSSEIAHLLRAIPGSCDIPRASRKVLRRMAAALDDSRASPDAIAVALYQMYLHERVPEPAAEGEMVRLDDAFALARQGVYSRDDVVRDLRSFLSTYS